MIRNTDRAPQSALPNQFLLFILAPFSLTSVLLNTAYVAVFLLILIVQSMNQNATPDNRIREILPRMQSPKDQM